MQVQIWCLGHVLCTGGPGGSSEADVGPCVKCIVPQLGLHKPAPAAQHSWRRQGTFPGLPDIWHAALS